MLIYLKVDFACNSVIVVWCCLVCHVLIYRQWCKGDLKCTILILLSALYRYSGLCGIAGKLHEMFIVHAVKEKSWGPKDVLWWLLGFSTGRIFMDFWDLLGRQYGPNNHRTGWHCGNYQWPCWWTMSGRGKVPDVLPVSEANGRNWFWTVQPPFLNTIK